MIAVPANVYLDQRQPDWLDHELHGRVRYDPVERLVRIHESAREVVDRLRAWSAR